MAPADDAGTVAAIRSAKTGGISWDVINSNDVGDTFQGTIFSGSWRPGYPHNEVVFHFDAVEGPIEIEFDYMTVPFPWLGYPAQQRTMVLSFEDGSLAPAGIHAMWNDPYTNRAGGVGEVLDARVYGTPPGGVGQVLLYSTKEAVPRDVLEWTAPRDPTVTATFQVRRVGSTTWTALDIERRGMNFVVDPKVLDSGEWEYEIVYQRNSATTASAAGTFRIAGSDTSLNRYTELFQVDEPFRPVPNDQLAVTDIVAYDEHNAGPVTIGSIFSADYPIQDNGHSLPEDDPHYAEWTGTNSVELTWPTWVRLPCASSSTMNRRATYSRRTTTGPIPGLQARHSTAPASCFTPTRTASRCRGVSNSHPRRQVPR